MSQTICTTVGCDRPRLAKGMCRPHWQQARGYTKTVACTECGTPYLVAQGGKYRKTCSPPCAAIRIADLGAARARPRVCPVEYGGCAWCGGVYVKRNGALCCSEECRRDKTRAEYRGTRQCTDCGCPLIQDAHRCIDCRLSHAASKQEAVKQTAAFKAARQDRKRRRRARLKAVDVDEFKAADVYERDRWRCGICSKRVNPKTKWPDLNCASLDHIVPLSWGGEHSWANTQLAHFICNSMKSDRTEVQPAMFAVAYTYDYVG